jgi:hypothetical protein
MKVEPGKANMKDVIVPEVPEVVQSEVPSLMSVNEFLGSISKYNPIETLGGFVYWAQRQGAPKKWSKQKWEEMLKEFLTRKV